MSGNVEDRWIWRGSWPVTSSTPTPTILPTTTLHLNQAAPTLTGHFMLDSEVKSTVASQINDESQTQLHTTTRLINVPQTTTINGALWNRMPNNPAILSVSPNKTTVEVPLCNWDSEPVNITASAISNKLNSSSVNSLPTVNTMFGINNSTESYDYIVNVSGHVYHNSNQEWQDVPTMAWTLPLDELTRIPSHTKNVCVYAYTNSTGDLVQGPESIGDPHYTISYTIVCMLLLLLTISILANSTIFFTIICRSYMRRTYFILYLSLAVSDLLASVFIAPVVILDVMKPKHTHIFPVCPLVAATMVLTSYVSVGTICSICTIRWWQFYNFSQTRTQEKLAVHFFILMLWTTGTGIFFGLTFQDIVKVERTCTLDKIVTVLRNTLPLTSISVSVGFMIIIVVNYLTIKKVQKKSIYPHDHQGSRSQCFNYMHRFLDWRVKLHYVKENESFNVTTLDDYSVHMTKYNSHKRNQVNEKLYKASVLKPVTSENTPIQPTVWEVGSSIHSTAEKTPIPKNNSVSFELMKQTRTPVSPSCEGTAGYSPQETKYNYIKYLSQNNQYPPVLPLNPMPHTDDKELKECVLLGPAHDASKLTGYDTDLESEHIYEVIEPSDVQKVIPQNNSPKFPRELQSLTLPIPNTVENIHNTNAVIMRETTINNTTSAPPENHTVNTFAWKIKKVYESLPNLAITREEKIQSNKKILQPQDNSDISSQAIMSYSTYDRTVKETTVINSSTPTTNKNLQSSTGAVSLPSPNLKPFFPLMNTEDSTYTGYMADLSATSSTYSTPHHKLSAKQRAQRISALSTGHTISRASEESEYDSPIPPSPVMDLAGTSHHQQACPPPPISSTTNPAKQSMHPVRIKCVRISQHLVAFFATAYLPLLALQVLATMVTSPTVSYAFIIYISFLLAIHPSLYGLQSPILKNAIRKLGKKWGCLVQSKSGNQPKLCNIHTVQCNAVDIQPCKEGRQPSVLVFHKNLQ